MSETGRETSPAREPLNARGALLRAIVPLLNSIVGLLSLVMFVLAWGGGWALRDEIGGCSVVGVAGFCRCFGGPW